MSKEKLFKSEDFDKPKTKPWYKQPITWIVGALVIVILVGLCFWKSCSKDQPIPPVNQDDNIIQEDTIPNCTITSSDTIVVDTIQVSNDTISHAIEEQEIASNQDVVATTQQDRIPENNKMDSLEIEAKKCIRGDYGNGDVRKQYLGTDYNAVQNIVNQYMREGKIYW